MVSQVINLALRGLQFLWTLLVMSLIGNVIADAYSGNPSEINYTMFVAVFAMLSLFYLILVTVKEGFAGHPIIPLVLDVLNTLFYFCAGVALAAGLDVHSCSSDSYTRSNHLTNGSFNRGKRCRELQATTAFCWFAFLCFAASMVFSIVGARGGANMRMGGIRKGPAMSQV